MHTEDAAPERSERPRRARTSADASKPRPRKRPLGLGRPDDPVQRQAWRTFQKLGSVGPATAGDLVQLGFRTVDELRGQDARVLYRRMCELSGQQQDPCVEDVFRCVIAQAEQPDLPAALRQWHHWTPLRGLAPEARPKPQIGRAHV